MRCDLSMLTTRRSWLMSLMVLVLGTSTSMPDCRMGAVIMKMMRRTRTTSTNGTILISESEVCVDLTICIVILRRGWWDGREKLVKCLLDLRGDFHSEIVQALPQVTNVLQKLVVKDDRGDGGSQARGRGDQRFGNTWCDGAKAGGAGAAEAGERVNDAPNRAEQATFLKNHGPGNEGEEKKDRKNAAGDPSGLHENFRNIGRKNRVEKKNDVPLSEREIFSGRKNRSIRTQPPQPIRCESFGF